MTPFEKRITAQPEDIDELGHVNNAAWVRWIQDMATAHWRAVAPPEHVDAYIWVVTRHEIDYLRAVGPGETVTGRTWVGEAPKGARFDRHVEFVGDDGKPRVRARTTWAILDKATGAAACASRRRWRAAPVPRLAWKDRIADRLDDLRIGPAADREAHMAAVELDLRVALARQRRARRPERRCRRGATRGRASAPAASPRGPCRSAGRSTGWPATHS